MTDKRWFDDWFVTYGGDGRIEFRLPHSGGGPLEIKISAKERKKLGKYGEMIEELLDVVDCALSELTWNAKYKGKNA